jgi:hypothetical protein
MKRRVNPAIYGFLLIFSNRLSLSPRADYMGYIHSRLTPFYDRKVVVYDGKSWISAENRVQSI